MNLLNVLPINLHRPATSGSPLFALVDAGIQEEVRQHRWLTATSAHVVRSVYNAETGKSAPGSLARFVWTKSRVSPAPKLLAHANGDLLDCRDDNLIAIPCPALARSGKTGACIQSFMLANGFVSAAALRQALGEDPDGVSMKKGRQPSVSVEQARQLLDERAGIGSDMSLKDFNAEVCPEILGKQLSPLLLSRILQGKISRVDGYDYSIIKPFRRR